MTMENKDRLKNMVFKYLDELFRNIKIEEIKLPKLTFSLIDTSEVKMIEGSVGDSRIFGYSPDKNTIYFDKYEYKTMSNIFGFNSREGIEYVKSYLIKNVGVPDDVTIYIA